MPMDRKGGWTSFGEYLKEVRQACSGGPRDTRLKTTGHMETGDDAQGGYLVPEEWADGIFNIVLERAIVRPRAQVLRMTTDSLKVRRLVESTRASSYFGGITFNWEPEAYNKTGIITKPAVGELELTPHKLIGGVWASDELMADYGTFGTFMQTSFGQALAFEEDYWFVWGVGGGQPLGIMNAGAMITHARTNNGGAPKINDLGEMAERLLPGSWATAVWMMHPEVIGALVLDATAGANAAGIIDFSTMQCMGRPIILTEKCAGVGVTGDVILADWNHYVIGNRSLEISASREASGTETREQTTYYCGFLTDETFWRVVLRVDGQPVMDAPVTPKLGTDTLSAFVVLTTIS